MLLVVAEKGVCAKPKDPCGKVGQNECSDGKPCEDGLINIAEKGDCVKSKDPCGKLPGNCTRALGKGLNVAARTASALAPPSTARTSLTAIWWLHVHSDAAVVATCAWLSSVP